MCSPLHVWWWWICNLSLQSLLCPVSSWVKIFGIVVQLSSLSWAGSWISFWRNHLCFKCLINLEIMRSWKIVGYYEHVKVAYLFFLPEFHMWQAASRHVRSGCINHVFLRYIRCAGWWKPLTGQAGGWRTILLQLEWGKEGWGKGGNLGKAQDFFSWTDGQPTHHQVKSDRAACGRQGIQTSSDGLLISKCCENLRCKNYQSWEQKTLNSELVVNFSRLFVCLLCSPGFGAVGSGSSCWGLTLRAV